MNKAKRKATYYGKYYNTVEYEYRGYTYDIEFGSGFTTIGHTPRELAEIHKTEQEKIDKIIEAKENPKPYRYEDTAEYGLNYFYQMIEEGE